MSLARPPGTPPGTLPPLCPQDGEYCTPVEDARESLSGASRGGLPGYFFQIRQMDVNVET